MANIATSIVSSTNKKPFSFNPFVYTTLANPVGAVNIIDRYKNMKSAGVGFPVFFRQL